MKVTRVPAPSPHKEVDPDDVVVTEVQRRGLFGGWEAWGYLRSEMRMTADSVLPFSGSWRGALPELKPDASWEPGPTYRIAYEDDHGRWQAEGTVRRESPPESVMAQIIQIMGRMAVGP